MANVINATSTGNGGLVSTGDDSGILNIQTNETTAITVDASQKTSLVNDATISGLTVGKGGGAVSTNTVVGSGAMTATASGGENVAVGYQALYSNTSGYAGVSIGRQAGYSTTTGIGNTYMGYLAGYTNTTNGNNTYLGNQAGYSATGATNTFLGKGAGYSMTTGSSNVILGGYSGNQGGLDSRTATNAIILSDGDGNPKGYFGGSAYGEFTLNSSASQAYNGILNFAEAGTNKVQQYYQKNVTSFYIVNSSAGVYLGAGSTAWASASDERLKDIIEPIENGLTKVASLRAVIGKFKTDAEGTRRSFLIAQDVQAVLPEAISTTMVKDDETNTEYLGVSYTDVIPLLVASIKELKAINDTQAETINALTARIVALEQA